MWGKPPRCQSSYLSGLDEDDVPFGQQSPRHVDFEAAVPVGPLQDDAGGEWRVRVGEVVSSPPEEFTLGHQRQLAQDVGQPAAHLGTTLTLLENRQEDVGTHQDEDGDSLEAAVFIFVRMPIFGPKRKMFTFFSSSLPRFDKCHETSSRIFMRTEQTFANARSFGVIFLKKLQGEK